MCATFKVKGTGCPFDFQPFVSNRDCVANFCRVTGTPEELIVDFGLNYESSGTPTKPVEVTQRLVINFFTAKRLVQALGLSLQRHEQAFGVLETDVRKRIAPAMAQQMQQAAARQSAG